MSNELKGQEQRRLQVLADYAILDTLPEPEYDAITRLASRLCGVPVSLITLLDDHRQWFKSALGVSFQQTPLKYAFCRHTFAKPEEVLEVPDARKDSRFSDNPLTLADPGIVFYAGAPLVTPHGDVLGALCVIDHQPNSLTADQKEDLQALARQVVTLLELRLANTRLEQRVAQRTEELNELLASHQAVLNHAGVAIAVTDEDGIIRQVNPTLEAMTGYEAQELVGKVTPGALRQPDIHQQQIADLMGDVSDKSLSDEAVVMGYMIEHGHLQRENTLLHKEGHTIPVISTVSTIYDKQQIVRGFVDFALDITALKEAQQRALDQERRLWLATQMLGLGIWEQDLKSGKIQWDEQMHRIHGTNPALFEGTIDAISTLVHPDDRPTLELYGFKVLEDTRPFTQELRLFRPDGRLIYTQSTAQLLLDEAGNPSRVVGVVKDRTLRKEAEMALQESEQRFREMAEQVDDLYWVRSADKSRFEYVNPAFERMAGLWGKAFATSEALLQLVPKEDHVVFREQVLEPGAGGSAFFRFRLMGSDCQVYWYRGRVFPVLGKNREVVRYVGAATDITAEVEKETVLRQALEQEQLLSQHKTNFITTVSHEFRTPLATLQSSVDILRIYTERLGDGVPPSIPRQLRQLEDTVRHLTGLLADVLLLNQLEEETVAVHAEMTDLVALCGQKLEEILAGGKDSRRVKLQVAGVVRPVFADQELLKQVLENLVSNALKFSVEDAEVRLLFNTGEAVIEVEDWGRGIPAADVRYIFERFYRASNAGTIQGTGLGLALVRHWAELMGAKVEVDSKEGEGSRFRFCIPIKDMSERFGIRSKIVAG